MQRYSGQKTVSIIYDHHRDHNPSFIQQRRSFNNITIVPIEKRQRRLSFRRDNQISLEPIQHEINLSKRTHSFCLSLPAITIDSRKVVSKLSDNNINYRPMRSCNLSYGFILPEETTNNEDDVSSKSRKPSSSASSSSSVSISGSVPASTSLSASFKQRKHVVKELVKTQADFVSDMKNVLIAFDSVSLTVTESNRYLLLGNLDQLVRVSDDISMALQKEISKYTNDQLGNACIAKCINSFRLSMNEALKTYILNFSVDASTKNPEIQAFSVLGFKNLQSERPNILTLNDELIKPVQRLVKLKQLFELLKDVTPINHPDCLATTQMFNNFDQLAYDVNEVKRWKEICASVSEETRKYSLFQLVDKSTKRIIAMAARSSGSEATRKIQQKFLTEREAINHIEKSCASLQSAVESRSKRTQRFILAHKDFICFMKKTFLQQSIIKLHPDIPTNNCSSNELPVDLIINYEIAFDTLIHYMDDIYMRKMSSNVLNRLSELKKLINISKRLLDKYDNTELNIVLMEASMKNHKNIQAVVNMQLQREDNMRNLSTLQFGLQNILPSLVKSANSILISASQYAFILQSNLMQEAENLVHKCINDTEKSNISIQPGCNISPAEFIIRVDKLKSLLYEAKRCRTHRTYEVPNGLKWEEESTCSDKNNLPLQESPVMSVSSHLSTSGIDTHPCLTIPTGSVISNSLSPYPEMKIIYHESDNQQEQKLCTISSGDHIKHTNTKEQPSTSKHCVNDGLFDKPTHRITHDFSSKNKSVVISAKGCVTGAYSRKTCVKTALDDRIE
ncbi:unnamed protein product [Schistosoma rodhaini]|uniref:DH domain-containing protein n=1 Tax=Schistosoma rodhaini TaxID=6188 RepID=A0AA85EZR5_9TREM|nr:unnamed protein product [Schistosoma rodhaini]